MRRSPLVRALTVILLVAMSCGAAFALVSIRSARTASDPVNAADARRLVGGIRSVAAHRRRFGPVPGTYDLRGSGRESIDILGGSLRILPTHATFVVAPADESAPACMWTLGIVLARQHVEQRSLCTTRAGQVVFGDFQRTTTFLGHAQTSSYTCRGQRQLPRTPEAPPARFSCTEARGGIVHYRAVFVDGHIQLTGTQRGRSNGSERTDLWLDARGLPRRMRVARTLTVRARGFLGSMHSAERWDYARTTL